MDWAETVTINTPPLFPAVISAERPSAAGEINIVGSGQVQAGIVLVGFEGSPLVSIGVATLVRDWPCA